MKLVDVNNEAGNMDQLTADLTQAVQQRSSEPKTTEAPAADPAPAAAPTTKLPPKLEGKSLDEIVQMYSNLESAYGRMANDLGTQRKLTDRMLDLKRDEDLGRNTPPAQVEPVTVKGADLLDNPTETLDKYFESRLAQLQQGQADRLNEVEVSLAEQQFTAKHGDISDLGSDEGFTQYVTATPLRQSLAQKAAQGDFQAADQLLDEWNAVKALMPSPAPAGDAGQTEDPAPAADPNLEAARKAALEGSNTGAQSSGKQYRRADLIELKLTKPHIYADPAFQDEIMLAYAQGRVK